jgi:hypothetical protein
MEIRSESRIKYPRDQVYRAYRDRLPEIAKYIPDIKEIVVKRRDESADRVKLHNEWIADREIPGFAQAILKPEHLRWDDHAEWHDDEHYVAWTLKTRAFTDAVHCEGRNTFLEDGSGTRVVLTGDLTIDLKEIPGVPSFLAKRIAPQVEKFIVSLVTPNLERVNASIERFLDVAG